MISWSQLTESCCPGGGCSTVSWEPDGMWYTDTSELLVSPRPAWLNTGPACNSVSVLMPSDTAAISVPAGSMSRGGTNGPMGGALGCDRTIAPGWGAGWVSTNEPGTEAPWWPRTMVSDGSGATDWDRTRPGWWVRTREPGGGWGGWVSTKLVVGCTDIRLPPSTTTNTSLQLLQINHHRLHHHHFYRTCP